MTTTSGARPDEGTPQRRVLVVEDEPTIAHAVASIRFAISDLGGAGISMDSGIGIKGSNEG